MESSKLNLYRNYWRPNGKPWIGITPVKFCVYSFLIASLFTLVAVSCDVVKETVEESYISYATNISWSLSLIAIFPAVLGLTFYYYQKAPTVLMDLYRTLVGTTNSSAFDQLCKRIDEMANHRLLPIAVLLAAVFLNIVYFRSFLIDPEHAESWMFYKEEWSIFDFKNQFTYVGYIAVLIQVFLTYWIILFIVKNLIFIRGLYEFFQCDDYEIKIDPLHSDGVNGLGKLRELATIQATIILFIGFYASLKVIDKVYQQQVPLLDDPGNLLVLVGYIIFAPLLFFLILGAARQKTRKAKEEFLDVISNRISVLIEKTIQAKSSAHDRFTESAEQLTFWQDQHIKYSQRILVWPFNWRSLQGFFGVVIVPLIPPISTGISYLFNA
ncbi:hypothetical protein [Kaarinaea lacus]